MNPFCIIRVKSIISPQLHRHCMPIKPGIKNEPCPHCGTGPKRRQPAITEQYVLPVLPAVKILNAGYRLRKLLPLAVCGKRACALRSVSQIQQHQNLLVFRQAKRFGHGFRVKEIEPAALHAAGLRGQQHMGGHNGRILHAGIPLFSRINKDIIFIKRHDQDCTCIVPADSAGGQYGRNAAGH